MRIIINERQYRFILEQKDDPKVYTDKKEYDKAMKEYKKQLDFYNFSLKIKKYIGKFDYNYQSNWWYGVTQTEPYVNTFLKIVHSKIPEWVSISLLNCFTICAEKRDRYKEILKAIGNPKIIKWHKVTFGEYGKGNYTYYYLPEVKEPIKPIYKEPTPVKPTEPIKTEPVVSKPSAPPVVKTNFVVQWQEDGKQKIKFFQSYKEWNDFVDSKTYPFISKSVNNAKTKADITYSSNPGLTADGSYSVGDKIY